MTTLSTYLAVLGLFLDLAGAVVLVSGLFISKKPSPRPLYGFGDMRPNSTLIRMLVAVHILVGYALLIVVLNIVLGT